MIDHPFQSENDQSRARAAVLEQLLAELERSVVLQDQTLQQAVAEAQARAEQLACSETLLKQRTRILDSVIESMGHGVVVADESGKFWIFNRMAKIILHAGSQRPDASSLSPDDWTVFYGLYLPDQVTPYPTERLPLMCAMGGEVVTADEIFVRHDQTPPEGIWLSVNACPLFDEQGAIRGGVAVFRDITEQRRAKDALEASERRFRDLFEQSPDPVFVEDLDGKVLDVNPAGCRLHGCAREELLGKNLLDLVPPEHRDEALKDFPRLARREIDHAEGFSWTVDGRAIPVEIRVSWIDYAAAEGPVPAVLIHVHDLTERKRHEQELERPASPPKPPARPRASSSAA